jgi:hypothetical protein
MGDCRERGMGIIARKNKTMNIAFKQQMGVQKTGTSGKGGIGTMSVNGKIDTEINNRVQKANQFYYKINQTAAGKKKSTIILK